MCLQLGRPREDRLGQPVYVATEVPEPGGTGLRPATRVDLDQVNGESHWPEFLPDGRHFIYHGRRQKPGIYLGTLDTPESSRTCLTSAGGGWR